MSDLGHKRTFRSFRPMSALPPKADIRQRNCDVRFVPKSRHSHCSKQPRYSITSSARGRNGDTERSGSLKIYDQIRRLVT